MSRLNSKR